MLGYWFSLTPSPIVGGAVTLWTVIGFLCLIAGALVASLIVRRTAQAFLRQPWARVSRLLVWNGILLFVLLFFRYEGVPFLGARFWVLLLVLMDGAWCIAIARHFLAKLPAQRRAWEEEQRKQRYLK